MNAAIETDAPHAELPQAVVSAIAAHRIVLVVSPITDIGLIARRLAQLGLDYHRVEFSMRSPDSRAAFERLRRVTRWRSLPQVFMDGAFIGGIEQLFDALSDPPAVQATEVRRDLPGLSSWARGLGYAGLMPFFALALLSLFAGSTLVAWATDAMLAYGATILSFIGALHWTRGLQAQDAGTAARLLSVSVTPALLGWIALLLPAHAGLALLGAGFVLLYLHDTRAWRGWPAFLTLRTQLTAGALGSLAVAWLSGAA